MLIKTMRYRYTTTGYFILLCFADNAFFHKFNVCGNPVLSKTTGTIFPATFVHFISLSHILVILTIFQIFPLFHYICYCDLWLVNFVFTIAKNYELAEGSDDGSAFFCNKIFLN